MDSAANGSKKDSQSNLAEFANPKPSALIASFRAFGYDTRTAIADLIDNSISADARNIWVNFFWSGESSSLTILDDGVGMDLGQLINAMRPGSISPLDSRRPEDLGRFGLGLKTASFSQCRQLIVATKKAGSSTYTRSWDLDHVLSSDNWQLVIPNISENNLLFKRFKTLKSGTLIIWEKMDRITEGLKIDNQNDLKIFHDIIDGVSEHLSMTFHRFMTEKGGIKFYINDNLIEPWDPFLQCHPATQDIVDEQWPFNNEIVKVEPFVLPHHSKLDKKTHEIAAGPKGWNAHQGFYVYRNKRLLVPGSWLNLGLKKEEHYKLARILIDIPNTLDSEWQIDVRKTVARPPPGIKDELKRIANFTRKRASDVYRHRGKDISRNFSSQNYHVWKKIWKNEKFFYHINRKHPLVEELTVKNQNNSKEVNTLLKLIEATIPIPSIVMAIAENPDSGGGPFEDLKNEEIESQIAVLISTLIKSGQSPEKALTIIGMMEEFHNYIDLVINVAKKMNIQAGNFNERT